jgi:hypothetical protein
MLHRLAEKILWNRFLGSSGLRARIFLDLLGRPGIDSQPLGPVQNPICRTGPPGYIGL